MQERFVETARKAGATAPSSALSAVAAELLARWSEPHRHYHNVTHLTAVLDEVEHEPVVALAAWGHDAIYDPRSAVNEERSALLTTGLLWRCGLPAAVIQETSRLVLLTAGHASEEQDQNGAVLADADLAILASPWPQYQSYVDSVRAEYAHVPDELWRIGRPVVLRNLLDLPALYRLHPDREQPARANIDRELTTYAAQ